MVSGIFRVILGSFSLVLFLLSRVVLEFIKGRFWGIQGLLMIYLVDLGFVSGWVILGFAMVLPFVRDFSSRLERPQISENMFKTWFER